MTIEQKAKAYDETIERAKKVLLDCTPEERKVVEYISPELKETEGDGIRGAIIDHLKDNNLTEWADWLEKQSEHKLLTVERAIGTSPFMRAGFENEPADEIEHKFKVGDIVQYITDSTDRRKIEEIDTLCNMYHTDSSPIMFEIEDEWEVVVNADDEIEIPLGVKDNELQEATYYIPKGFHVEIDDDKVFIKKGEKPIWSEDDSYMLEQAIKCVNNSEKLEVSTEEIEEWLKALGIRMTNKQ